MFSSTWAIRAIGLLVSLVAMSNAIGQASDNVADELLSIHDRARFAPHGSVSRLEEVLAKTDKSNLPLRAEILIELSNAKLYTGNKPEALRIAKEAEVLSKRPVNKALLAKSLLAQAYAMSRIHDEPASRLLVQRAKDLADGTDDIALKVQASISLGESVMDAGHFSKGMVFLDAAVALAESSGNVRLKVMAFRARAVRLTSASDYANAFRDTDKLITEARRSANAALQARASLTEFSIASQAGNSGRALSALKSAIYFLKVCGEEEVLPGFLVNLSDIYLQIREFSLALETSRQAIALAQKYRNTEIANAAMFNHGIADIYLGNNKAGRQQVEKSMITIDDYVLSGSLLQYASALVYSGDTNTAMKYYQRAFGLVFSASEKSKQISYEALQRAYQYEQRQREIATLQNRNLQQKVELREQQQQRWRWSALAASSLAVLSILSFFALRFRRKNQVLARQRNELAVINEKLQWQSDHDTLTGTFNRRFFENYMSSDEMHVSLPTTQANNLPLAGSLILIDVDHFKKVNDTFGHCGGDMVLQEVASRLESVLRNLDILVRWGGEEFLVFLPGADNADSAQLVEQMLHTVSAASISSESDEIQVTISAGYCPVPLFSDGVRMSWESSIKVADAALYFAKKAGRNKAYGIEGPIDLGAAILPELQANFGSAVAAGLVSAREIEGTTSNPGRGMMSVVLNRMHEITGDRSVTCEL